MFKVRSDTVGMHGWAKAQFEELYIARPPPTSSTAPTSFALILPSAPSGISSGAMGRVVSAFIDLLGWVSRTPRHTAKDGMHEPSSILGQRCAAQPC